ncbi:hypothetical protein LLG90_00895 [Aromatoleum toluclasticum]|uniref:hypothetical protein n=1 Tax=Aromatoleum toluclasticum TaxID=92003 RepID=UPI001D1896D0|nr:hypothetical protein [Aromatoleum toluclasticum]MCC4113900.1 hypothetical protein [Aromatoleum toluclasticum]
MAKQDANQTTDTSAIEKGLGVLERAWDAQWALRLICVVLFFDMAMLLRIRRGLWQWSDGGKELLSDVGWLALTFVAFSFAAAIGIPVLLLKLRQLSVIVMGWLPAFLTAPTDRFEGRPLGYAPAGKVRDLALREKDDFLLRIYEAHEREKKTGRLSQERAGELTAAALLAALADWLLGQWIHGGISLIGVIVEALADWAAIVTAIILLCAGVILKWAWFSPYSPDLIYYPPLDRELRDKEGEERQLR